MKNHTTTLFLACAVLLISSLPVCAATQAIEILATSNHFTNNSWCIGFEFDVLNPIVVTDLGFYDDLGNGLTQRHDVGIWDSGMNLLASTTVSNGDPLDGYCRYHAITPLSLPVGTNYRVAAVTGTENYTWDPTAYVIDPNILFKSDRYTLSTVLAYPTSDDPGASLGIFGANFRSVSGGGAVPEPMSVMLGIIGLGSVAGFRRLRRK